VAGLCADVPTIHGLTIKDGYESFFTAENRYGDNTDKDETREDK
jgi:hypothetical protein